MPKESHSDEIAEIVAHLNAKSGKAFRASTPKTARAIRARFAEGFSLPDFFAVIDAKCADWGSDPKMAKYLRPETLFGTKFEGYLNEGGASRDYSGYRF